MDAGNERHRDRSDPDRSDPDRSDPDRSDPDRSDPERIVDELEDRVLGARPERGSERPDDTAGSTESAEAAFEQDMDVEDLPGGAGQGGGSSYEPPS